MQDPKKLTEQLLQALREQGRKQGNEELQVKDKPFNAEPLVNALLKALTPKEFAAFQKAVATAKQPEPEPANTQENKTLRFGPNKLKR